MARDTYIDFLIEQLSPLGEITAKSMFGGHCLYCNSTVFGLVANGMLYLKADQENTPAFEAHGSKAFRPFEDKPGVMQYYEAPPEIFEDADALRQWVGGAIQAGMRAKTRKPARPRARKS